MILVHAGNRVDGPGRAGPPRFPEAQAEFVGWRLSRLLDVLRPRGVVSAAAAGVIGELMFVPADLWGTRMIGSNSMHCLMMVPLLSIAPLAALLLAMRAGAPQNPGIAGALAGAAAAGVAATLYAANCPDDSPLFVASWYPLATIIVAAIGAVAGARLLRW